MKEKIICAAIWYDDGKEYPHQPKNVEKGFVLCGRRHHDINATLAFLQGTTTARLKYKHRTQGFLTTKNHFVDRHQAALIAINADQLINFLEHPKWSLPMSELSLNSEDIY